MIKYVKYWGGIAALLAWSSLVWAQVSITGSPLKKSSAKEQDIQLGNFVIKGKMAEDLDGLVKVYLRGNMGEVTDSCRLQHGSFEFKGQLSEPFLGTLTLSHEEAGVSLKKGGMRDSKRLWIAPGQTVIEGQVTISEAVITDSQINEDWNRFNEMLKAVLDKEQRAQDTMVINYSVDPKAANEKYTADMRKIRPERMRMVTQFVDENPDSYISLEAVANLMTGNPDISEIAPLFDPLSDRVKSTPKGKKTAEMVEQLKVVGIGRQAPLFTQNDVNGKPVSLSDFRGKYLFIDFWASWCIPCRAENPDIVKAYNRFKDQNFAILGVSLDSPKTKQAWIDAIEDDGLDWAQVSDLKDWNNSAAKLYAVRAIPANFLIDPSGKIIAKNLHGEKLGDILAEIFGVQ